MKSLAVVVLAAGSGRRMQSNKQKVMSSLWGKPLLGWVLETAFSLSPARVITVIGHRAEEVRAFADACYPGKVEFVEQAKRLGTGHAVNLTRGLLKGFAGDVLVLCGDVPMILRGTLEKLISFHRSGRYQASLLSGFLKDPTGYGRIVRGQDKEFERIVEERDCSPFERSIHEINSGVTCFEAGVLFSALHDIQPHNGQKEYYLTDIFHILKTRNERIGSVIHKNTDELFGINSRDELKAVSRRMVNRWHRQDNRIDVTRILSRVFSPVHPIASDNGVNNMRRNAAR